MKKIILICFCLCLGQHLLAQQNIQKELQTRLIMAEAGEVIEIGEGTFVLNRSLSMDDKRDITIMGKGMNKTILSFKDQEEGAEGIRVSNCQNIWIRDLTVQNARGDAIKAMNVDSISFSNVRR